MKLDFLRNKDFKLTGKSYLKFMLPSQHSGEKMTCNFSTWKHPKHSSRTDCMLVILQVSCCGCCQQCCCLLANVGWVCSCHLVFLLFLMNCWLSFCYGIVWGSIQAAFATNTMPSFIFFLMPSILPYFCDTCHFILYNTCHPSFHAFSGDIYKIIILFEQTIYMPSILPYLILHLL